MKSYIQLKEQEYILIENNKTLRNVNIGLIKNLINENKEKFPNEFKIIEKDLNLVNFNIMVNRLEILIEDIKMLSIEDDIKNNTIENIEKVKETIFTNNKKTKKNEERLIENKNNQEARRNYLKEKRDLIDNKLEESNTIDEKISIHKQIIGSELIEQEVKEAAEKVVGKYEKNKIDLENELNIILEEPYLEADLIQYEIEINKNEELREKTISILDEKLGYNEKEEIKETTTEVKEEKEELEEELKENTEVKEEIKEEVSDSNIEDLLNSLEEEKMETFDEKLNPVVPEEAQEVVEVHQAPKELKMKLKKAGKISLGILAIGAAVATIIANPISVFAVPGTFLTGGLLYDQVKERIKKK